MAKERTYFYDVNEYSNKRKTKKDESSLFLFIQHSIYNNNFFLKEYLSYIIFLNRSFTKDDIISECYLKALKSFKKNNNYSVYDLRNNLKDIIKFYTAQKRKCASSNLIDIQDMLDDNFCRENVEHSDSEDNLIVQIAINTAVSKLDKRSKEILIMYYVKGYTYDQISKHYSMRSKRSVKKKIDVILRNIKKEMVN